MTNEEFQNFVIQKLTSIDSDVKDMKVKLNAVYDQTANLTEFKTEANSKLDTIIEPSFPPSFSQC